MYVGLDSTVPRGPPPRSTARDRPNADPTRPELRERIGMLALIDGFEKRAVAVLPRSATRHRTLQSNEALDSSRNDSRTLAWSGSAYRFT